MTPLYAPPKPLHQQCPRCNSVRMFATQLTYDPHEWSMKNNQAMAAAWLGSHPCRRPA